MNSYTALKGPKKKFVGASPRTPESGTEIRHCLHYERFRPPWKEILDPSLGGVTLTHCGGSSPDGTPPSWPPLQRLKRLKAKDSTAPANLRRDPVQRLSHLRVQPFSAANTSTPDQYLLEGLKCLCEQTIAQIVSWCG
ncbi:hypothetical protein ACS0TY_007442 [Phlomoides rotata]